MPDVNEVIANLTDLPTLPDVVAKLTRLIADPKTSASDINDVLSKDPGLAAKILKLVNSPYYGFVRRIATISSAVVILGYTQVRNLALSAFIFDSFGRTSRATGFDMKSFWKHCIGSAFIGSALARHLRLKLEEDAFMCGLLHDLGKWILAVNLPADLTSVMRKVRGEGMLFYTAEKQSLAYDHAHLGAAVMERWNLPESLVEAVKMHHTPLAASEPTRMLAVITSFSDILARALLMGSGGDDKIPLIDPQAWAMLNIGWPEMEKILRKVALEYWRSDEFFAMS